MFALLDHLLLITAVLTLFHNLQYHRIVWQYEQGRGRTPLSSLGRYLGLGCLFGLLWYGPRILGVALIPPSLWRNVLLGLGWGLPSITTRSMPASGACAAPQPGGDAGSRWCFSM